MQGRHLSWHAGYQEHVRANIAIVYYDSGTCQAEIASRFMIHGNKKIDNHGHTNGRCQMRQIDHGHGSKYDDHVNKHLKLTCAYPVAILHIQGQYIDSPKTGFMSEQDNKSHTHDETTDHADIKRVNRTQYDQMRMQL